ncbi:MAG: hypothetical protein ACTTH5_00135 [Wolinella sp.]
MKKIEKELENHLSSGVDSFRFIMPKSTFLKFIKKIEFQTKLRAISRNRHIKQYAEDKFKGQKPLLMPAGNEFKIRYISFKRGINSLTNSMILLENSNQLNDLCKKRKKPYGYYVMVVFAGLYQPSREIYKQTYSVLSKFLRRFKAYEYDIAHDFMSKKRAEASNKEWFSKCLKRFSQKFISYKSTLYANECNQRFYGLSKICFYDKYQKQTQYHKQKIDPKNQDWHRVELTFRLNEKFLDAVENKTLMECVYVLDEIANKLTDGEYPFGVDITTLNNQIDFFKDNRRALSFAKVA